MKYTKQQLMSMATEALEDRRKGGMDYMVLAMTMCMHTGLSEREVERRIQQLAETGTCDS